MQNEMRKNKRGIKHLLCAFRYSWNGLSAAIKNETAIRHELILGVVHIAALMIVPMSLISRFVLIVLWILLIVVELINSAIESVVDLVTPNFHPLAGLAKDYGSAAVFLCLIMIALAWVSAVILIL